METDTPTTQDIVDLLARLQTMGQEAPGWIASQLTKIHVRYGSPNTPQNDIQREAAKRVQQDIALLGPGIMIVYYFAMFEEYLPPEHWAKKLDITPSKVERLRAYRHIRHSFAHSGDGTRAKLNKKDLAAFEAVMATNQRLPGVEFTETHITALSLNGDVLVAMKAVANEAVAKM